MVRIISFLYDACCLRAAAASAVCGCCCCAQPWSIVKKGKGWACSVSAHSSISAHWTRCMHVLLEYISVGSARGFPHFLAAFLRAGVLLIHNCWGLYRESGTQQVTLHSDGAFKYQCLQLNTAYSELIRLIKHTRKLCDANTFN
jgi:hypothetical protein